MTKRPFTAVGQPAASAKPWLSRNAIPQDGTQHQKLDDSFVMGFPTTPSILPPPRFPP